MATHKATRKKVVQEETPVAVPAADSADDAPEVVSDAEGPATFTLPDGRAVEVLQAETSLHLMRETYLPDTLYLAVRPKKE